MNLPINQGATYTITIPSSGKQIKFRQFLVKEQKALLIAQQSNDEMVIFDTLKEVIKSCVKDPIDVDKLALFDVEYLFVNMRSKSVGETIDITLTCPDCNVKIPYIIDLEQVRVDTPEKHSNKIHLFDDVGVVMKYPSFETMKLLRENDIKNADEAFNIVLSCMDYIYDTDNVYKCSESTKEKLMEFIDNLDNKQMNSIKEFIRTMPRVYLDIEYTCTECQKTHKKRLEGLASFF